MNDWLKNTVAKLKSLWASWKPIQKVIAAGILVAVIVVLVVVFRGSSKPTTVQLFRTPITDEAKRDEIVTRLEQKNIDYTLNETTGIFTVPDERTARRVRADLTVEGILASSYNVWDVELNVRDWTTTDFERNERQLQRVNNQVEQMLKSLDFVADATVIINQKSDGLLTSQSRPAQASIRLRFNGETPERRKIKAIQDLVISAVPGLLEENVTILDNNGIHLNDFEGMAELDAVEVVKKQQEYRMQLEAKLAAKAQNMLQSNFTTDRVRSVAVSVEWTCLRLRAKKPNILLLFVLLTTRIPLIQSWRPLTAFQSQSRASQKNGLEPAIIRRGQPESKGRILLFIPTCRMSSVSQRKRVRRETMSTILKKRT